MSIYGSDGGEESMSAGLAKGSTTTSPVFDLWAKLDADQQKYAKIGAAALGESPAAPLPSSTIPFLPLISACVRGAVVVLLLWLGLGGNDSDMANYMGGSNILV